MFQNPVAVLQIKFFRRISLVRIQNDSVYAALSRHVFNLPQEMTPCARPLEFLGNAKLVNIIFHAVQPRLPAAQA